MISKERLLAISELKLAGKINAMSDKQFHDYVKLLYAFIDIFPTRSEKLRADLDSKAYDAVAKDLSNLRANLARMHADELAAKCRAQIDAMTGVKPDEIDHDSLEAFIENFIQNVSALSIDIQMAARKAEAHAPRTAKRTGLPLILAVDNAVMFINTLRKLLHGAPYDLHCVTTSDEVFRFLQNNRPDAFLLDIEMPDMDGYELARRIKKSGQRAPIIFVTANSAKEYVDKAIAVGAVGLLMKPIRINQLLAKLKEFV